MITKNILKSILSLILKNQELICDALRQDMGRSSVESHISELVVVKEELKYFIKNIKKLEAPRKVPTPFQLQPGKSYIKNEPYGTVLIISPWNFPFHLGLVPAIGALAAGNRVIIKTSPHAHQSSRLLSRIINEELNSELIRVEEGGNEKVHELLQKKIDFIFYTGSEKNGREIYQMAAQKMIPIVMELGGQNPLIFHKDGYLKAIERIVWGKLLNAGQTCLSPNHIFVHESIKDAFVDEYIRKVFAFYGQDTLQNGDYPQIINEANFNRLSRIIEENRKYLTYGGETDITSLKIAPALLELDFNTARESSLLTAEIFGPILPVISYRDEKEVIDLIASQASPLALYLFSSDKKLLRELSNETHSGSICVNDCLVQGSNPNFPFGGVHQSGIGKYHGYYSFQTFSHPKNILIRSKKWGLIPRFPPYSKAIFNIYKYI